MLKLPAGDLNLLNTIPENHIEVYHVSCVVVR